MPATTLLLLEVVARRSTRGIADKCQRGPSRRASCWNSSSQLALPRRSTRCCDVPPYTFNFPSHRFALRRGRRGSFWRADSAQTCKILLNHIGNRMRIQSVSKECFAQNDVSGSVCHTRSCWPLCRPICTAVVWQAHPPPVAEGCEDALSNLMHNSHCS